MQLSLKQKSLVLVLVPVLFELFFIVVLFGLLRQAEHEVWRETHSKAVISESNDVWRLSYDSGISLFGYAATHHSALSAKFEEAEQELENHLNTLKLLTQGHPKEQKLFEEVNKNAQEARVALRNVQETLDTSTVMDVSWRIRSLKKNFEKMTPQLVAALSALNEYEKKIAKTSPKAQEDSRRNVFYFLLAGIVSSTAMAFALANYFNKEALERLAIVVENTRKLAVREKLNAPVSGSDEIAKLDRVFHDMVNALELAAQRKQELMSMVSHDLRSPLMAVDITLDSVCGGVYGDISASIKEPLSQSRRNTERLIELINDLLDIEKLESGTLSMNPQDCSVCEIFDKAFDAVSANAEQKMIDLEIKDSDCNIWADADRLSQVLINLLSNAIKFSPSEGHITVAAEPVDGMVEFTVVDEGRGVPVEKQAAIFERFSQVSVTDAERGKGTGLGLAICKAIVEAHGGSIGVISEPDKGSKFWFRVPAKRTGEC